MFRPVFLFKILIISLIINFILLFYFLLKRSPYHLPATYKNNFNDYYYSDESNLLSTNIKVIPIPMIVNKEDGIITLSNNFHLMSKQTPSKDLKLAIRRYSTYISTLTGLSVDSKGDLSSSRNTLIIDCSSTSSRKEKYPTLGEDESYTLSVTRTGSYLNAITLTGVVRGLATFVQLIENNKSSGEYYIPIVKIIDQPRFPWRGLMLDVSRHWMPLSVIERTLNAMELNKLNVLHLHLSDDHGFRVESIRYNLLHDRNNFFTQKDIKHIVEYARQRRIRIVPEFDIPGHTTR